jgi:PAS domain S-box-containing protein
MVRNLQSGKPATLTLSGLMTPRDAEKLVYLREITPQTRHVPDPGSHRSGTLARAAPGWWTVTLVPGKPSKPPKMDRSAAGSRPPISALRQPDEKFESLLEHAADTILLHDIEGRLREVNRRACESLGYTRDELLRMNVTDVEQDVDLARARQSWTRIVPGHPVTFLGRQRRKDGSTFPVEVRLTAVAVEGERLFMAVARDVSSQRRAEDALRESEAYFRACFEGNSAAMAIIEADTTISMVNDAYCKMSGYPREVVVGMSWTRQIPPGDLERLLEYNRRRLSDPAAAPDKYEFTFYRRDGELRHGLMSVALIPDRRKIVASFLDITERKQVEEKLRVSEERHRLLADNALDVVWTMAADGSITYVSPSVEKLRGFTPEEAMRQSIEEIHPPASQAISLGYFTKLYADVQAGRPPERFRGELEYRCRDGSTVWTEVMAIPILDPDGAVAEVLGVSRDLSERKAAEQALREAEARFRSLAESSPVGIIETDARGVLLYANRAAAELAGVAVEAMSGQTWSDAILPEDRERLDEEYRRAIASDGTLRGEYRMRRPDGTVSLVRGFVAPLLGPDGRVRGFIGVAADITEEHQLREQLSVASRLAALGTLVAGVAHEINNPLGGALASHGFVEEEVERIRAVLRSGEPLDRDWLARSLDEAAAALHDAQAGERRVAAIVKDLALFGRPDPRRGRVAPARAIEVAMRWLPPALRQRSDLQVEDEGAPDVLASEGQLSQVILNLVTNAIQSVPEERRADVRIRIGACGPGRTRIEVSDDGSGMPPEVMKHVFDPFYTTRDVGQGMGLGLSISHAIVTAHGGTIAARSEPGKGTTFRVELPAA